MLLVLVFCLVLLLVLAMVAVVLLSHCCQRSQQDPWTLCSPFISRESKDEIDQEEVRKQVGRLISVLHIP